MSFVWGQSLPSNHYRTSDYRRTLFAETQTFASTERRIVTSSIDLVAVRKRFKDIVEQMDEVVTKGVDDAGKNLVGNTPAVKKLVGNKDAAFKDFDELLASDKLDDLVAEGGGGIDWLRAIIRGSPPLTASDFNRIAQTMTSQNPRWITKVDIAADVSKKVDEIKKLPSLSPRSKYLVNVGAGAVTIVGGIYAAFNSDAAEEAVERTLPTCQEQAEERGLTVGTPEYDEAITECQEGSAARLERLGWGALGVVGLLGFIIIARSIPKKSEE